MSYYWDAKWSGFCVGFLQVRTFNLQEIKVIRDLNPSDINQLIAVSGMVTRASNIIPDMRYLATPVGFPRDCTLSVDDGVTP